MVPIEISILYTNFIYFATVIIYQLESSANIYYNPWCVRSSAPTLHYLDDREQD